MQLVVGAALVHGGRVLAARRSYPPATAGRWEFPGGKVDAGETPEDALVREVAEELGCAIALTGWLAPEVEIGEGLVLRVATAALVDGEPIPRAGEHDAVRWVDADQLEDVDWLEADRPFAAGLRNVLVGPH
jgi:8-oxo-dGTP diphosphatase